MVQDRTGQFIYYMTALTCHITLLFLESNPQYAIRMSVLINILNIIELMELIDKAR